MVLNMSFVSPLVPFAVIIHIHVVVSHAISVVTVIISLFKGKSIVNVIWVCCPCDICTCVCKASCVSFVAKCCRVV